MTIGFRQGLGILASSMTFGCLSFDLFGDDCEVEDAAPGCPCSVSEDCSAGSICFVGRCDFIAPRCGYDDEGEAEEAEEAEPICSEPVVAPGMVFVPCGSYVNGVGDTDNPVALRVIDSFLIDRTEVSVEAYRRCVVEGRCSKPEDKGDDCTWDAGNDLLPINCVSWCQADTYCRWANKRLPSEWEWEWVARNTTAATPYPWGSATPSCELANYDPSEDFERCVGGPASVFAYSEGETSLGVRNLGGNVNEYTSSWLDPERRTSKVVRGGSWDSDERYLSASRRGGGGSDGYPTKGFRCARTPLP